MEAGGLDRGDAERVAEHAGGNPLFIIEITGMLHREDGDRARRSGSATAGGPSLPTTVQAVIAARIDQLSPPARELVRRASVFPRGRFDTDELSLIAEPTPELLAEAENEELLLPDEEHPGRVAVPQRRAARRRVRLARQARAARLHLRVADRLSEPELAERYPRTIAFHLELAARASLDLESRTTARSPTGRSMR